MSEIGGDGFDPDGCAACGGELLIKVAKADRKAWLRCSGCGSEFRLAPIFIDVVRQAIGDPTIELDPIQELSRG